MLRCVLEGEVITGIEKIMHYKFSVLTLGGFIFYVFMTLVLDTKIQDNRK